MRREWYWALAALAALGVGVTCATPYAKVMAPFYTACDRWLTAGHPWRTGTVEVRADDTGSGAVLSLTSEVRRHDSDPRPAARTVSRVQVGEAIETPVVYWTLLLLWPATARRRRWVRVAVGIPLFLGLETITTAVQLIQVLPEASARLAGEPDPLTVLERWSRFLEAGGHFVVEVLAVLVTLALANRITRP